MYQLPYNSTSFIGKKYDVAKHKLQKTYCNHHTGGGFMDSLSKIDMKKIPMDKIMSSISSMTKKKAPSNSDKSTNAESSETEPESSETEPESSETEPESPETESESSETAPESPETDLKSSKAVMLKPDSNKTDLDIEKQLSKIPIDKIISYLSNSFKKQESVVKTTKKKLSPEEILVAKRRRVAKQLKKKSIMKQLAQ